MNYVTGMRKMINEFRKVDSYDPDSPNKAKADGQISIDWTALRMRSYGLGFKSKNALLNKESDSACKIVAKTFNISSPQAVLYVLEYLSQINKVGGAIDIGELEKYVKAIANKGTEKDFIFYLNSRKAIEINKRETHQNSTINGQPALIDYNSPYAKTFILKDINDAIKDIDKVIAWLEDNVNTTKTTNSVTLDWWEKLSELKLNTNIVQPLQVK